MWMWNKSASRSGDKYLREQHFREKSGTGTYECNMSINGAFHQKLLFEESNV